MGWVIAAVVAGVIIGIIAVFESKSSSTTESVQTAPAWTAPKGFFGHWDLLAYVAEFCAMGTEDMSLTVLYSEKGNKKSPSDKHRLSEGDFLVYPISS